jgi:hypothetical protein
MSAAVAAPTPVEIARVRLARRLSAWRVERWLPIAAVWLASVLYVAPKLDRGWFPMDEGTLAQPAERVLQGELPHRDFDDVYTGGLATFDAAVFRAFGTRLIALRFALFGVFLLWVPAVYYVATRFARPIVAAAVTLLGVVWSIPTNPSAMPSWYNLFLATFGTAALLRFTETRHIRWIVVAGVAGGLSVLVKIVGLYYIAAALFFFAFDEHSSAVAGERVGGTGGRWGYPLLVTVLGVFFVAALVHLVRAVPRESKYLHFVVPGAAIAALLSATEWRDPVGLPLVARVRRLARLVGPFVLGVALPTALFLVPYVASGSVGALVHGVFVEPAKRFQYALVPPASLWTLPAALPWLVVLVPPPSGAAAPDGAAQRRGDRLVLAAYVVVLALLVATSVHGGRPYIGVWLTVCYVAPSAVLAGCVLLISRAGRERIPAVRREQLWLLVCMTAMCSLIQIPQAGWGYILYFAPIAILTLLALLAVRPSGSGTRPAVVAGFFLVFGIAAVNPAHIALWEGAYLPPEVWPSVPLAIPRTGLKSIPIVADGYQRIVSLLDAHSPPGGFIYAAPDCPELYFLSGRRNPTRTLYDFFDDSAGHDQRVLSAIDSLNLTAVAINTEPRFSPPMDSVLSSALRARFPDSAVVYSFLVRWRQ